MLYMESNSFNSGVFRQQSLFDISADPDLAAVEIQNRVKLAESRLPAEVIQNGISVEKQAPSQLITLYLTSTDPKFDEIYLSNTYYQRARPNSPYSLGLDVYQTSVAAIMRCKFGRSPISWPIWSDRAGSECIERPKS